MQMHRNSKNKLYFHAACDTAINSNLGKITRSVFSRKRSVSVADLKIQLVNRHSIKSSNLIIKNENSTEGNICVCISIFFHV